jgi:hypothetical protein
MSQLEVDKIIPQSGTTLTIGDSGDTIAFGTGTTPQLGGDLDLNSNDITGTGNINITGTVVSDGLTVDGDATLNGTAVNFIFNETDTTDLNSRLRQSGALFSISTVDDSGSFLKAHLVINNSTGDISFYEDTGTTPKLFWDASAERLLIGATSASNLNTFGDDLIVSNTSGGTGSGISIISNATNGYSNVYFGDTDDADIGRIQYHNLDNSMTFRTNASDALVIDSSGNVGIGSSTARGRLTVSDGNTNSAGEAVYQAYIVGTARNFTSDATGMLTIQSTDNMGADKGGSIAFGGRAITGNASGANWAGISGFKENSTSGQYGGYLGFSVRNNVGGGGLAEVMRIDSSSNVGINETSAEGRLHVTGAYTGTYGRAVGLFEDADLTGDALNQILVLVFSGDDDAANATFVSFRDSGGEIGAINALSGGTTVQYITSSDYRLKENINYDFDATSRLKQLKPARFNFKTNTDRTLDGFLAHEVSDIVPEAVSGTKDETETKEKVVVNSSGQVIAENIEEADWENGKIADEDGNTKYPIDSTWEATKIVPVYQGIDQSKLVPLLVASLKEALTEIDNLKARVDTLEGN